MKNQNRVNPTAQFVTVALLDGDYKIIFDINALMALEEQTGKSPFDDDFWPALTQPLTPASVRLMLWAAMRTHHAEIALDDVNRLIHLGNMGAVMTAITTAQRLQAEPETGERPTIAAEVAADAVSA